MNPRSRSGLVFGSFLALVPILWCATALFWTVRDFSSPAITLRLVDEKGSPQSGLKVQRRWYDSDLHKEGSDDVVSDEAGVARFAKVWAHVGPFTGSFRRVIRFFASCGVGSGTSTSIGVSYHGLCTVVPKGKLLHPVGLVQQDPQGVYFAASSDSESNTYVSLTLSPKAANFEYVLVSSKSQAEK